MKNKRASTAIYGIMLSLVVIILALSLAPTGKFFIGSAMNATTGDAIGMNCSSDLISNFDKATCTVVDFSLFYFFGSLIFIAGIIVTGRIIFT